MSTTRCELLKFARLLVALLALTLLPRTARAQEENREAAKPLFEEARRLLTAGKYQEACAKLEETRKLYAGAGVLLNLGDCYEHLGRTASAWTAFGESAAAASRAGRSDEEAEANRRRALLTPRVPHLVVQVTKEVPGLVVTRDGTAVPRSDWGQPVAVDPGPHDIKANAAGYLRWETRTTVPDSGQTVTVATPELQVEAPAAPAPVATPAPVETPSPPANAANNAEQPAPVSEPSTAPPPVAPSTSTSSGSTQRVLAVVSGATGLAAMGTGGVLALVAKSKYDSAEQEGVGRHADSASAVSLGNVATGVVIAGGVLAAAGVVLWFTAPRDGPQVGYDGRQVLIGGTFK